MSIGTHRRDLALRDRMLAGDERAFDEFFERYFPGLYRFVVSRVDGRADAAEDIVQAALTRAVTRMDRYRGEAGLFTWLCTLCRHEIWAHFRRAGRESIRVDLVEDAPEVHAALVTGPEAALERAEIARLVQVALDRLPGSYGHALEWKYLEGSSVAEIGERLGLSTKAAESLLTRARNAFRDVFATLARGRAAAARGTN